MSNQSKIAQWRNWLTATQQRSSPWLERFEHWATGAPLWALLRAYRQWQLARSLAKESDRSFATKRLRDRWRRAEFLYRFGRCHSPQLKAATERYGDQGWSERVLRLLVANNNLGRDGQLRISMTKEVVMCALGWLFNLLCAVSFLLNAALVWAGPVSVWWKLLLTGALLVLFVPCAYVMSRFTIAPYRVSRIFWLTNAGGRRPIR